MACVKVMLANYSRSNSHFSTFCFPSPLYFPFFPYFPITSVNQSPLVFAVNSHLKCNELDYSVESKTVWPNFVWHPSKLHSNDQLER